MTSSNGNNSSDRLDRIERLLESVAPRTDSNARAIQGILEQQSADRLKREFASSSPIILAALFLVRLLSDSQLLPHQKATFKFLLKNLEMVFLFL